MRSAKKYKSSQYGGNVEVGSQSVDAVAQLNAISIDD